MKYSGTSVLVVSSFQNSTGAKADKNQMMKNFPLRGSVVTPTSSSPCHKLEQALSVETFFFLDEYRV